MKINWAIWMAFACCTAVAFLVSSDDAVAQTPDRIPVQDSRAAFVDRVTFSCERTGVLIEVPEEGDKVTEGDIVVRLNDSVPQANLAAAQARTKVSEVEISVAEKTAKAAALEHDAAVEANRIPGSSGSPAFPKTHMDRLRLNAEAAGLQVDQKRREKEVNELTAAQALAELETFWIRSHFSGIVTKVIKRRGEGVQQGESIVEVVNTDRLRIEGYVSVENIQDIKPGMPVKVTVQLVGRDDLSSTREYDGKLGYVDVSVQQLAERVRVWAEIDNTNGWLREGLNVQMVILNDKSAAQDPQPEASN
ncbi:MAG: HlyD family efflux transporter periplasmic adaptor subunit [Planctomycetaceae bacterium]|nr:HlyD family efflux transporter periplasmic adaptor subunit [Planctomycetaceae bacterium]